ncbi:MAG: PstS family phosphate ABC transporter substrate-binding protein [Fischerella sp.]|jgi:phosphate transport system substrate-binding protein|uniref:PstS family phosphate ABC transporter substrate-binding protein n=1 Tax=Fischerella sp. TaxID=1191 RepID=UPI0017F931C0|nr:PstS family phosphate ABC transporter substrate-binding protein [Fischerella sp.]NWF62654.1 PstS family phosphate ABC transporter substrate-binding protein [Fischerella sp.]
MSEKTTETTILVLLLLTAAGLVGLGFWWASDGSGFGSASNLLVDSIDGAGKKLQKPSDRTLTFATYNQARTFAEVPNIPSGLFSYGGSTTWAPIRKTLDPIIQTTQPQFRLRYTNPVIGKPGSGTGIKMLLENQLVFSQSSRPVKDKEYQEAQQRGFSLKEIPVAIDGIAIAVHPNLNIPGLTVAQLKDIYTGKINNWKQVGGPDLPLTPYSRPQEAGGTVEFFVDNVLQGGKLGTNVKIVDDTTSGVRKVASDLGGIYYATAIEVLSQCKVKPLPIGSKAEQMVSPYQEPLVEPSQCPNQRNRLNRVAIQSGQYPITRRLFVIVKQNGLEDEQAGMAYAALLLSNQGQKLINDAGFISLR